MQYLMQSYGRLPVKFEKGAGAWLWDIDGKKYLDALCGIAVTGIGHAHPEVNHAISKQLEKLTHVSNLYRIEEQEELAQRVCRLSGLENAFFCNSGSEANEAAIKLARLFGFHKGIKHPEIVVMEKAWHGRSLATLTATGSESAQKGFGPLVPGFIRVPYDDPKTLSERLEKNKNIVAVMVEPIQGEAGIKIPSSEYLINLRKICDNHGILLIFDEVQTGMGRTGAWFAYQHTGAIPDILTIAKGLGNGFPIGACIAKGEAAQLFGPGSHGSTFGGNPVGCAAALAVFSVIEKNDLLSNAKLMGELIIQDLKRNLKAIDGVKEIRGKALMIAVEMSSPCPSLALDALDRNILINVTGGNTVRLLPPLILNESEAHIVAEKTTEIICSTFQ